MIDMGGEFEGVDRQLDIHIALVLPTSHRVRELLHGLGHDAVAVVVEPIDQGTDGGIFLILYHGSIVESAEKVLTRLKFLQQFFVVDVEAQGFGRGIEVCAINKDGAALHRSHG